MANKFRKAVEKRNMEIEDSNIERNIKVEDSISNVETEEELPKDKFKIDLSNIISKTQKKSKNKTFYLDEEVITSIEKEAKKQKVSDSKLLNDLLKHILNIKN